MKIECERIFKGECEVFTPGMKVRTRTEGTGFNHANYYKGKDGLEAGKIYTVESCTQPRIFENRLDCDSDFDEGNFFWSAFVSLEETDYAYNTNSFEEVK